MAGKGFFHLAKLKWLSGTREQRLVSRVVLRRQPRNIVELGLSDCSRTTRIMDCAVCYAAPASIQYTGIDFFDGRPAGDNPLPLKEAYRQFRSRGVNVRLIPGTPASGSEMIYSAGVHPDLVVIDARVTDADLAGAWRRLADTMAEGSVAIRIRNRDGKVMLDELSLDAVRELGRGKSATAAA